MWMMYEHPECNFEDMAMDFMDIRKRIFTFPEMGKKAYFVAVPTSSGTGSEVTPFAIITDKDTGIKWPLADYALLPNMAIDPECNFEDMAMDFMDIRKRIFTFPEMGKKAYFVAVPTSSGTGSEVTPFAIITDKDTGIKWPLADYALLPNMAIDDGDNAMTAPKGITSASGIDGMTHAIESLGLNHSMAHKLGAFHHLPHGIANAVILTRVMRYNAAEAPVKMGTFSQYPYPNALAAYAEMARYCGVEGKDDREVFENFCAKLEELKATIGIKETIADYGVDEAYAEMARYCGVEGKDDREVFENFCAKLEELKATIGIKETIADYGVDEAYFLESLDEMVEQAFNDQCTGANPRYPLMSEIKELYLDAYYGREPQDYAVL